MNELRILDNLSSLTIYVYNVSKEFPKDELYVEECLKISLELNYINKDDRYLAIIELILFSKKQLQKLINSVI